jgi:hypothetical protein
LVFLQPNHAWQLYKEPPATGKQESQIFLSQYAMLMVSTSSDIIVGHFVVFVLWTSMAERISKYLGKIATNSRKQPVSYIVGITIQYYGYSSSLYCLCS